ncbi:MAG TPA: methionine ABC transporter permease [Gammaproteobacteria bacterium]|nr:methionine ABC transporter permease [Gammaproteobacteria bacterium]HQZ87972.1 methionine ABC transporter permease [Gammaproteobacteria bacterium]HRA43056.1 methionine ABC transporter permease [Gammaproteobacteria bacterium]
MLHELLNALEETLFMVFSAGLLTWVMGLPIGALLSVTNTGKILENKLIYKTLHFCIHTMRSLPYIVFMIAMIPFTQFLVGAYEGCIAAVVPLTLAAIPYFAQLSEKALNRIQPGIIEAAKAVGASPFQIIYKVLIPEALPNIIKALTLTLVHLIGYSTIAGAIGAGGLGSLMIYKGYHAFHFDYVFATAVILIALIHIIQFSGHYIASGNMNRNSTAL